MCDMVVQRDGASHLPVTPNRNASCGDSIMAKKALPSPEVLRQLLRYDPETGKLFWRERPVTFFNLPRDCSAWNARYAGREALTTTVKGYRSGTLFDRAVYAHRVALAIHAGEWPEVVDHINGDKQDNRISNLRAVRFVENMRNLPTPITNTSGDMGVHFSVARQKWVASIGADGRSIFLGHYDSQRDATIARRAAEKALQFHANHGRALKAKGGAQ